MARHTVSILSFLAAVASGAGLGGCSLRGPQPPASARPLPAQPMQAVFSAVDYAQIDGWREDAVEHVAPAIERQCALPTPPVPWPALCASYAARGALPLRDWLQHEFQPWHVEARGTDGAPNAEGLITGYYEALLNGSRARAGTFQTPLYRVPDDLLTVDLRQVAPETANLRLRGRLDGNRVVPYHDRRAIDQRDALAGRELLWVDDPVEAFFLQVQGSGRVRLPDGSMVAVRYADQNGHPYRAIGRTLIDRGLLTRAQADGPGIKAWLRANSGQASEVMASNPSYVFFSEQPAPTDPTQGPPGSLGVALTPLRSIAVDRAFIPLGALVFVDTVHPIATGRLATLAVAQDTGGAIRGPVRADVFWGMGAQAELAAGRMRNNGRLWLLWPRGMALPVPGSF